MTNPENPYVTMTTKAIEQMIGKAIAPLVAENRKLMLAFGYATAIASDGLNEPAEEIQNKLLGVAARSIEIMPSSVPADLLMTAGVQQWKHKREQVKREGNRDGDRPQPDAIQNLNSILNKFRMLLSTWFCQQYGEDWVNENAGSHEPLDLLPINQNGNCFLLDIWQILVVLEAHEGTIYSAFSMMPNPSEEK